MVQVELLWQTYDRKPYDGREGTPSPALPCLPLHFCVPLHFLFCPMLLIRAETIVSALVLYQVLSPGQILPMQTFKTHPVLCYSLPRSNLV